MTQEERHSDVVVSSLLETAEKLQANFKSNIILTLVIIHRDFLHTLPFDCAPCKHLTIDFSNQYVLCISSQILNSLLDETWNLHQIFGFLIFFFGYFRVPSFLTFSLALQQSIFHMVRRPRLNKNKISISGVRYQMVCSIIVVYLYDT